MLDPELLLQKIKNQANGISLSRLLEEFPNVARRTAQRQIHKLIAQKKIFAVGKGPARRYFPVSMVTGESEDPKEHDRFPSYIPLSVDSQDILAYIEQPMQQRTPAGYQSDFLMTYRPNQTYYLSQSVRYQLHNMGDIRGTKAKSATYTNELLHSLLVDLSWASSHLEGNTYSRLDTQELIEQGTFSEEKTAFETQMILNHKAAIELIINNVDQVEINRYTLCNLHSALAENLLPNPADEGRIRQHIVSIGKSVYQPLTIPQKLDEFFQLLLDKARDIVDPFEQAFFLMVHLPYLQAFADINKRTSRLAANIPLIKANLCPLTFIGIDEKVYTRAILGVYEMTRIELLRDLFVWGYERSTHEYLSVEQRLSTPEPLRLQYRNLIKQIIHQVVKTPAVDPLSIIELELRNRPDNHDEEELRSLLVDELKRLHEGVLARYGLRPSEYHKWRDSHLNYR